MNRYQTHAAPPDASPVSNRTARGDPGHRPGTGVEMFYGIRSSGHYCSPCVQMGADKPVTSRYEIQRQVSVEGMCLS
jgi:hypothetical protein